MQREDLVRHHSTEGLWVKARDLDFFSACWETTEEI